MSPRKKYFDRLRANTQINYKDIIFCMIISIVCVLFFNHRDILITAERSVCYIKDWHIIDNICHFYSNSIENIGDLGANYLPTTFIIFAIWNLPLKILNLTPHFLRDWGIVFTLWNKLLPVLLFMASGYLLYKICKEEFGFSENKSKLAMYLFMTSPIAFFSQFLFCQYDIFTVFFMLLGIYYYYKEEKGIKNTIYFIICFGIAFTFKYFAVLIFFVLLFLKEKKVEKIIFSTSIFVIPAAFQVAFYLMFDRYNFIRQVFQFGVLNFATQGSGSSENTATLRFNILYLVLFLILAFAYLIKPRTKKDNINNFVFLSCGVCAILFSMMSWNPQWLLFGVLFWTLAICISKNYKALLFLDFILIYAFYAYVTKIFVNNVDQNLLQHGILKNLLRYRVPLEDKDTMQRFFILDTKTLLTIIVCVLIFYFLASHSGFSMKNIRNELVNIKILCFTRYFYSVLLFIIPAVICGIQLYKQPEKLWANYATQEDVYIKANDIKDMDIIQEVKIPREQINSIYIETKCSEGKTGNMNLQVEILDKENKQVAIRKLSSNNINENGFTIFYFDNLKIKKNQPYYIKISADSDKSIIVKSTLYEKGHVFNSTTAIKGMHDNEILTLGKKELENQALNMVIYGD